MLLSFAAALVGCAEVENADLDGGRGDLDAAILLDAAAPSLDARPPPVARLCQHWDGYYVQPEATYSAPGSGRSPEGLCSLAGCFGTAGAVGYLDGGTLDDLRALYVAVCRNEVCLRQSLDSLQPTPGRVDQVGLGVRLRPGLRVEVSDTAAPIRRLSISLQPERLSDFVEGDRWRFSVERADGGQVLRWEGQAGYSVFVANGEGCGPVCRSIEVQLAYVEGC